MAHNLTDAFLAKLENTKCEQLLTFVKVHWDSGSIVYSEQEILYDSEQSQWSYPALITVGIFSTALRLNNNGTIIDFSVTLDDSDGHLRSIFNREVLNGVRVDLLLNFAGLDVQEGLLIGVGSINSDNISWTENTRLVQFSVEDVLVSKSVAFKPFPDMIPKQEFDFINGYVPFVFGAPKRVPALRVFGGEKALTTTSRDFSGTPDPKAPDIAPTDLTGYLLDEVSGYEEGVSQAILFFKFEDIGNQPEGKNPQTGAPFKLANGGSIFILDHVVDEYTDINLLPFDVTDPFSPTKANLAINDPINSFTAFTYWWVDLDPATFNLTTSAPHGGKSFINFEDFGGRPSLFAYRVDEHIETPALSGKYRIKLSHQPRWGKLNEDRDPTLGNTYKEWWSNISVNSITGEFNSGIKIQSRSSYVKHSWKVNFLNYTKVERDGTKTDEVADATVREELVVTQGATTASLSLLETTDLQDVDTSHFTSIWIPEQKDTTLDTSLSFIWQLKDETGYNLDVKGNDIPATPNNLTEALIIPNLRPTSKYILNIFQGGLAGSPPDINVFAKSDISAGVIPVPSGSLTVSHQALIDGESTKLTVLDINPPLEYTKFEGFYTGEIFVDHTPAYLAHDGQGGVVGLDTENAVSVISWLLNVYTDLDLRDSDGEIESLRNLVSNQKMSFFIAKEVDAISLANIIAWEHKLALSFFNDKVRIINLNVQPKIEHTFTTSNVELKTLKLGFVPSNDIITDFRFRFNNKKDDNAGETIVFNNNINRYGKNTQFIDVLTLDNADDVFELVKFWGNRLSNAWRVVEFQASIEALKLQPYDAVEFDIPSISSNTVIGFVNTIKYEPNSFSVVVSCTLASIASDTLSNGEPATNVSYWEGLKDLRLDVDKRVGIVSDLDGAKVQKFSLTDLNTLKPFERRL